MSSYQQDKLALPIKRLVTRNFSGYDITGVQDIKEGQKQFYVIHLENKTSIKRVGVYEGELNVIEEFDKAL
jgi:hypothetical protein